MPVQPRDFEELAVTVATLFLFATVALVVIATPGPTVLLALANGSRFGVRSAVPGMLGAVASDFVLVGSLAFYRRSAS
ncbi:hypothetical protein A8M77_13050 [Variovorax sp. JS1663]|nr:hypothetical protein A8M77_13050 [Variovorax sp. JS1663]